MMYIQLSMPYRNYDKIKIKSIYVNADSITAGYAAYNNEKVLFEKNISITDKEKYDEILNTSSLNNFSVIDNLHKLILEYIIEKNIETGTLEVK